MHISAGGVYLLLLKLHDHVSLAAGVSRTIDTRRESLERATFGYRQLWIKSLFCIQEREMHLCSRFRRIQKHSQIWIGSC